MNINFGLFWVQEMKIKDKKMRNQKIATNAMEKLKAWKDGMATLAQP